MAIQILLALLLGFIIISLSLLKLWKPSDNCMQHEITLPLGVSFKGCSVWGVVLLIGFFLFYLGFEAANKNGADSQPVNVGSSFSVLAKAHASESYCSSGSAGWVYMGDKKFNERWWFNVLRGRVGDADGRVSGDLVMQAKSDRYLRKKAFMSLTGTLMGKMLGVSAPESVCIIKKNSKVKVSEFKKVGRNRAWAKALVL